MKVILAYSSGLMLLIPRILTNGPTLLLEWLSKYNAGVNIKVIDDGGDFIKIRLNCPLEQYQECAEYINANL